MQTTESKRGPGRPRSLTIATEKTIARRYATGKRTLAALAEHYSIAVGTVRAIVKRNPIEAAAPATFEDAQIRIEETPDLEPVFGTSPALVPAQ